MAEKKGKEITITFTPKLIGEMYEIIKAIVEADEDLGSFAEVGSLELVREIQKARRFLGQMEGK